MLISTHAFAMGWVQEGGEWYYKLVDETVVTNKWIKSNSDWFYVGADGKIVKNQWVKDNGSYYYVDEKGAMLKDTMTPDGYYVGADGKWQDTSKTEYDHVITLHYDDEISSLDDHRTYKIHYNDKYIGMNAGSTYVIDEVVLKNSLVKVHYHLESGYMKLSTQVTGTYKNRFTNSGADDVNNIDFKLIFYPDKNETLIRVYDAREMDCYIGKPNH